MKKYKIAIFASGSGSNAENIYNYFKTSEQIRIDCIYCNNSKAYVIERADKMGVDCIVFDKNDLINNDYIYNDLKEKSIDLIVLAGFLWLLPSKITNDFDVINIHPALLPKFGGKGMYGMQVHNEVIKNGEAETGITIHKVNIKYDEGEILYQAKCKINENDTAEDVAQKVHELEYKYFPQVIEDYLLNNCERI